MGFNKCKTAGCNNDRYSGSAGPLAYCKSCLDKQNEGIEKPQPKKKPETGAAKQKKSEKIKLFDWSPAGGDIDPFCLQDAYEYQDWMIED